MFYDSLPQKAKTEPLQDPFVVRLFLFQDPFAWFHFSHGNKWKKCDELAVSKTEYASVAQFIYLSVAHTQEMKCFCRFLLNIDKGNR